MPGSRANALLASGLVTFALLLAVHSLRSTPEPGLVAEAWPTTAVMTMALLLASARHVRAFVGLTAGVVLVACSVAGLGPVFSVGFALANAVEVLILVRWLTGFQHTHPQLRSWGDYRRWLVGIAVASCAAGAITAVTLGLQGGHDLWRPMLWVAITHVAAQTVILPLVMLHTVERLPISAVEVASHLMLLAVGVIACYRADTSEPVGFLVLPLVMWAGARFTPRWASIELLGVAVLIGSLNALGRGPFADVTGQASVLAMAASSQAFVAISAITCVAFSVAMGHLRDSLRRIRENEVQLGQLLDSASGTAFIATDLDGLITWFSPGAEQLLGYTSDEVAGQMTPLPFHESRELLARAAELGTTAGYGVVTLPVERGSEQDTRDWTYVRRDGSRLTVSISVTAVRDDDGHPQSYLSVVRDVTDRRAAEQALVFALDKERETNQRMLELDRAKGEFVSAVSHELRTPLTSIVGYTELLADDTSGNLSEVQQELIERIDRNGERLLHLVEDLLALARVEEGDLTLDKAVTDLRDAVRVATDEVSHAAHKARVALRVDVPPEPVLLMGDPAYLERLVMNLVSNAVKFTDRGGAVEVDLGVRGDVAVLRVVDNGMGIPVEEQGRIFQRFFRSSLASEHAIQGTGLGLNIVRAIAEAHNGQVEFESQPGVGTTFTFKVPLLDAVPVAPQQEGKRKRSVGSPGQR